MASNVTTRREIDSLVLTITLLGTDYKEISSFQSVSKLQKGAQ